MTELKSQKIQCKNLFCDAEPVNTIKGYFKLDTRCNKCGSKGFMPAHHVLTVDQVMYQILKASKHTLLKELFKKINYDKLPKNMDQQNYDDGTRYNIDIIATGIKKEGER